MKRAVIATALPRWIRPQLAQLVSQAPEGEQWLHEIKFDGYRMHAHLDRGAVKLLTGGCPVMGIPTAIGLTIGPVFPLCS